MSSDEDSRRAAIDEYHDGITRRPAEEVSEKQHDPIRLSLVNLSGTRLQ